MLKPLIYIGLGHSIYLAFLLLRRKDKQVHQWTLGLIFSGFALLYLMVALFLEQGGDWLFFILNFNLLLAPAIWFYVVSLTHPKPKVRLLLPHMVPYLLSWMVLIYLVTHYGEPALDQMYGETRIGKRPISFNLFLLAEFGVVPVYLILILRYLKDHRKKWREHYSYSKGVDLLWIKILLTVVTSLWAVVSLPDFLSQHSQMLQSLPLLPLSFALGTPFIFVLGHFGVQQQAIPFGPVGSSRKELPPAQMPKSSTPPVQLQKKLTVLHQLMTEKNPYLDPDLSAIDLAGFLGVTTHRLSQIISVSPSNHFYDFINHYRVEAFKRAVLLPENQHKTLLAIAFECGFKAKSSFNRIFKKECGATPSQYLASHKTVKPAE